MNLSLWNRPAPASVSVDRTADLEAAVETARHKLIQVERHTSELVAVARQGLSGAQEALDSQRMQLIAEAAVKWRERAVDLRSESAAAGDEVVTVARVVRGLGALHS